MRSSKRFTVMLLVLVLTLLTGACTAQATGEPLPSPSNLPFEAEPFTDVPAGADYAQAADWCREMGLMQGTTPTTFSPDTTLTRAMVVTILHRAVGEPAVPGSSPFPDVLAGQWYTEAILWASGEGIVNGYGGRFGPEDPITLEQLDVMIARYKGRDPAWTGDPTRAVPATRAQAATAFYLALSQENGESPTPSPEATPKPASSILVAYFSNTGNTESIARHIQSAFGENATLYRIVSEEPYTAADLNYNTDCRANREQKDPSVRPAISGQIENMAQYDVVFLGYPIWWGEPPRIIYTFLEGYDWAGKTVIPFCTSGSSPYSDSGIRDLAGEETNWLSGRRFPGSTGRDTVVQWVNGLELPEADKEEENTMYLQIGETVWTAALEDNPSADAWRELLTQGPVTVDMSDYGGFEKVGGIGTSLPQSNRQITTRPGDIILYQGTSITVYYDTNTWNFTPLGHVEHVTQEELKEVLKAGGENVTVTFSLTAPAL